MQRIRLIEIYKDLTPHSKTAELIAVAARLEETSEAAESDALVPIFCDAG